MSAICAELHRLAGSGTVHRFPFDGTSLPSNGIYVLFETGESAHGGGRIVRVGTHTGERQLVSRLNQHVVKANKDRSIFRKNIGRALLNKASDTLFLAEWEHDRTSRAGRARFGKEPDVAKRGAIEADVTTYIQGSFRFVVFRADAERDRLHLESRMISTLSLCDDCQPSASWLGMSSPKEKIRESGLWLVNELYKEPLTRPDVERLERLLT
jgi:hypothetical protein